GYFDAFCAIEIAAGRIGGLHVRVLDKLIRAVLDIEAVARPGMYPLALTCRRVLYNIGIGATWGGCRFGAPIMIVVRRDAHLAILDYAICHGIDRRSPIQIILVFASILLGMELHPAIGRIEANDFEVFGEQLTAFTPGSVSQRVPLVEFAGAPIDGL